MFSVGKPTPILEGNNCCIYNSITTVSKGKNYNPYNLISKFTQNGEANLSKAEMDKYLPEEWYGIDSVSRNHLCEKLSLSSLSSWEFNVFEVSGGRQIT